MVLAAGAGRTARVADRGPAQDAAAGRRRPHDPRHRARQPPPRRAGRRSWWSPATRPSGSRSAVPALEARHGVQLETRLQRRRRRSGTTATRCGARASTSRAACCSCNGDTVHPPEVEERLLAGRGHAELVLALDDAKPLGEEEMKVLLDGDGLLRADQQGARPGRGGGRVHRADADRAGGRRGAGRRAGGDLAARPAALLRGRLPGVRRPRRARRGRARSAGSSGSRSTTTRPRHGRGRSRGAAEPDGRGAR